MTAMVKTTTVHRRRLAARGLKDDDDDHEKDLAHAHRRPHGIFNHAIRGNMVEVEGRSEVWRNRACLSKRRKSQRGSYHRIMASLTMGYEET